MASDDSQSVPSTSSVSRTRSAICSFARTAACLNQREVGSDVHNYLSALKKRVETGCGRLSCWGVAGLGHDPNCRITAAKRGTLDGTCTPTTRANRIGGELLMPFKKGNSSECPTCVGRFGVVCQYLLREAASGPDCCHGIMTVNRESRRVFRAGGFADLPGLIQIALRTACILWDDKLIRVLLADRIRSSWTRGSREGGSPIL